MVRAEYFGAFNSTRYIRNLYGEGKKDKGFITFNSTRYIRNAMKVEKVARVELLNFQLHTVH